MLKTQRSREGTETVYESRLPKPLARLKGWLVEHHMTLMAIADSPHSIALGSAIGIFFGFTPLYPMKTLLSIGVAWIFRCNKIAAAVAVTLHDVVIWAMPAIYVAEYQFGCWILNRPAAQRVHFRSFDCTISCTGMCFRAWFGLSTGRHSLVRSSWPFRLRSLFTFSCGC
jgi:uncharacterized protein (DUF2062 family)